MILINRFEDKELLLGFGRYVHPDFNIDGEEEMYYNLLDYFRGYESGKLDTRKGLLICGDVGTGKTLCMKVFQKITNRFGMVTTRHIIRDYFAAKIPSSVMDKYGRLSFVHSAGGTIDKKKPTAWCFDDFGLESVSVKNYGNEQNILEEIMLDRYEMWVSCRMKTYVTTNLDVDMIEQHYGTRVRDRFRETMNLIRITGKSKRK